jgi:hypothetical protein
MTELKNFIRALLIVAVAVLAILIFTLLLTSCIEVVPVDVAIDATVAALAVEAYPTPAPTCTPHACPSVLSCPTTLPMPDIEEQLTDLALARVSITEARKALDEIMTMEGDYNTPPHTQAAVAINHLSNAHEWTDGAINTLYAYWQMGAFTCQP